ncbi:helix-turn-helix domain-containing protein [Tenacibaculum sp. nBUS_03]|uniref:helix-turn-helix domain-containing protein n=1 Tax=Tenacibaculum sp. nBUS_03 TaxID=3395320 RepID=UPI003EBB0048
MSKSIFFILFSLTIFSFSQTKNNLNYSGSDSVSLYNKKCLLFINRNQDSLKFYINKLKSLNNKCNLYQAYTYEAKLAYLNRDYKKTEQICKDVLLKIKDDEGFCFKSIKISIYVRLFWLKKKMGEYNIAYKYLIEQEKILNSLVLKDSYYHINKLSHKNHLAIIKSELGLYNEALEILKPTLPLVDKFYTKDKIGTYHSLKFKSNILNSIGNVFLSLSKKNKNLHYADSASFYYKKGYNVAKKFNPPHKNSKIIYNLKKTKVLIAKKEYYNALKLIDNYKNIHNGYNYNHYGYFQKAVCYYNLKNADSTIFYSNKLLNNKNETCKRSTLIAVYDILSNQYNNLKKLDSAFKYSKLTMEQYELAKKNKEKTFQSLYENDFNKVIKLNEQIKKQSNKKQNYLIVVFSIIVLSLILLGFIKLKIEKKKKLSVINKLNNNTKEKQPIKKEYNIDIELENQILSEIKKINSSNIFLKSDFSVSSITEEINTNSTYVSFVFNKHYKESFKQFYTKKRINYIINKLKTDVKYKKYSIQALGEEIGYTNASAFSRAFKKQTGLTPSSFLKKLEN